MELQGKIVSHAAIAEPGVPPLVQPIYKAVFAPAGNSFSELPLESSEFFKDGLKDTGESAGSDGACSCAKSSQDFRAMTAEEAMNVRKLGLEASINSGFE